MGRKPEHLTRFHVDMAKNGDWPISESSGSVLESEFAAACQCVLCSLSWSAIPVQFF
jgi:hypothetical protein